MTCLASRVHNMLERLGKPAVIVRQETTGPEWNPTVTDVPYDITIVETGYTLEARAQTSIKIGDRVGVIATGGETDPVFTDDIKIGGERLGFVELQPMNPSGTVLGWTFVARA